MDRTLIFGIVLFLFGLVVGLSIPGETSGAVQEDILGISGSTQTMGSAGANSNDLQLYSYNYTLYNSGSQGIYVRYVEPVFNEEFEKLVISEDRRIYVNKSIGPESAIQVSGNVEFNMTGLSKEDILKIEHLTTGIEVNSVFTLPFP
ncbi:MAG: hypothetical protein SCH66_13105 [Methanolobus sp.]|nr:hypothetical protein [Methanolobus sp.]